MTKDIHSVKDLLLELDALREENNKLKEENLTLTKRLENVTLWDLSPKAQEDAGRALARSLLGGK